MNFNDFTQRLGQVDARGLGIELAALVACVVIAWVVTRWFGRDQPKDSIWFGERTFDGLLFPLLALVFAELARRLVSGYQPVLVLRIGVSVFLSLAVIRLFARVMRAVFPASNLVRLLERGHLDEARAELAAHLDGAEHSLLETIGLEDPPTLAP